MLPDADEVYDARPEVIVNSVCPGICNTDLSRALKERSLIARMAIPVAMSAVGKTPEHGARYIIAAALSGAENHVSTQSISSIICFACSYLSKCHFTNVTGHALF
jgi:NAD(P)-dependent dehydrogenase (short-subunit alcohol dehydrogenase family)